MSVSRKEKDQHSSSFGRKLALIGDWIIIALFFIIVLFIAVGYLQPVVEKPGVPPIIDGRAIKVQLFGGCRRPDEVMEIAELLRKLGIDVMEIQSTSGFTYPNSLIVDRTGNPSVADSLAKLLGLPNERVVIQKYNSFVRN